MQTLLEFPKLHAVAGRRQRRYLFYSHDAQGLGHTQRNLAIAAAIMQLDPEAAALLVTGTNQVHRLGMPADIGILKLPGLRKVTNQRYEGRNLQVPASDVLALRAQLLRGAVEAFRPNVLLADKHPLGAHHELIPALQSLRAHGGKAVLGLRDILDDPARVEREWAHEQVQENTAEYYERILIYGDPQVFDPISEYRFLPALAERTSFCGYVVNRVQGVPGSASLAQRIGRSANGRPLVVASTGGGEDGFGVLEGFVRCSVGANWKGVAVSGPLAKRKDCESLRQLSAATGVTAFSFVAGLGEVIGSARAMVCMGGYNTLVESVSSGTPTVCVPRIFPRREQLIRAQAFADLGLLRFIEPSRLNPILLRAEIENAIEESRPELRARASILSFDGARQAARHLRILAGAATTAIAPMLAAHA